MDKLQCNYCNHTNKHTHVWVQDISNHTFYKIIYFEIKYTYDSGIMTRYDSQKKEEKKVKWNYYRMSFLRFYRNSTKPRIKKSVLKYMIKSNKYVKYVETVRRKMHIVNELWINNKLSVHERRTTKKIYVSTENIP